LKRTKTDAKPSIIVAMPTRGSISAETHYCLRSHMDGFPVHEEIVARKPVVEARNELARRVRSLSEFPFVLWVDDDAWWPPGWVTRAVEIMSERKEIAILFGLYGGRGPFAVSVALGKKGHPKLQLPGPSQPVEVLVCGFHWVLMRREVLDAVGDDPFSLSDRNGFYPEDFSFCERVVGAKLRMFCAPDLYIAHVEPESGHAFIPGVRALKMTDLWLDMSTNPECESFSFVSRSYGKDIDERNLRHAKKENECRQLWESARLAAERGDPDAQRLASKARKRAELLDAAVLGSVGGHVFRKGHAA
jgi:hypothetical protein